MPRSCRISATLAVCLTLAGTAAHAAVEVAPLNGNFIFVSSEAKGGGQTDLQTKSPNTMSLWIGSVGSYVFDNEGHFASAGTNLLTSFAPDQFAMSFDGNGDADGGTARGGALIAVFFFVERCQQYSGYSILTLGSYPSGRCVAFIANLNHGQTQVIPLVSESPSVLGRLSPGAYVYYVQCYYGPESGDGNAPTYATGIGFTDVPNPLIQTQPTDQTVNAGSNATLSVGASGLAAARAASTTSAMTYQWRKGLQNLADGGRISGVHTSQLVIANAAVTDSGLYDVVVTSGSDVEPSSLVYLTVTGGTTDAPEMVATSGLRLEAPSPSPFAGRTQIRFSLPRGADAALEVLDVNGRLVKRLLPEGALPAGGHAVTWDGRGESGAGTPAGVYFVRRRAGGDQMVRRVVNLGGGR